MKKVAIVGFGAAGYNGAKAVRQFSSDAVIDIYSDGTSGPYNPMLTTYYVKNSIPYEAMFPYGSIENICRELRLNFHGGQKVVGLEPKERRLHFADGSCASYDQILIATGASAVMPPISGLDLPGVFKMRTLSDAAEFKRSMEGEGVKKGIVIGASWVGVKVVEDFCVKNIPCTLLEGAEWMFASAVFRETAQRIQRDLEAKGVEVHCGQMLSRIEREPDGRLTAVTACGARFTADMVAVCLGVSMNIGFLRETGIAVNRGVLVDRQMRTNFDGIYAAGDCCEALDTQRGQPRNIGLWANAVQQGTVAGANMAGQNVEAGTNILVNLAHYMGYDFLSMGDPGSCKDSDEQYKYEDHRYYIQAVRDRESKDIRCTNIIGPSQWGGVIKNAFVKSLESPHAPLSTQAICLLKQQHFPDSFIKFLGRELL